MTKSYLKAYGRVPIGLVLQKPKASVIYVYIALDSFQGGNGNAFPKIDQICERSGLKKSSVKMGISWLVRNGWLTRVRRYAQSSIYVCLHEVAEVDESGCVADTDEPDSVAHYEPDSVADYEPNSVARILKAQDKSTQEKNNTPPLSLSQEENTKNDVLQIKTEFLSLAKGKRRWEARETKTAKKLLMHFPLQEILENLRVLHRETMARSGQYGWTYSMQKLDYKWDDIQSVKEADLAERERLKRLVGYAT